MGGIVILAKASIRIELRTIPSRLPQKNRLPIFMPPRMNSGRLIRIVSTPTLP